MMSTDNFNSLKIKLFSYLESCGLNASQINEILSDEFINGALELQQQEPLDDSFISLVKNVSNTESLYSLYNLEEKLMQELTTSNYFSNLLQYMLNSLKNANISQVSLLSNSGGTSITSDNVKKARIGIGLGLTIVNAPTPVKAIAGQLGILSQIAVGTYEQDKKIWEIMESRIIQEEATLKNIKNAFSTAHKQISPLIIDLDGDGVETTMAESGTHFDHDGNNFAESTGWVGKDDGLLVRDINGNGQIDDGTELFGNNSVLSSGEKAANFSYLAVVTYPWSRRISL